MAMTMGAKSKPHMTIGARLEAHMRQREKKVGAWLEEGEREDKGRKELKQRRRGGSWKGEKEKERKKKK